MGCIKLSVYITNTYRIKSQIKLSQKNTEAIYDVGFVTIKSCFVRIPPGNVESLANFCSTSWIRDCLSADQTGSGQQQNY